MHPINALYQHNLSTHHVNTHHPQPRTHLEPTLSTHLVGILLDHNHRPRRNIELRQIQQHRRWSCRYCHTEQQLRIVVLREWTGLSLRLRLESSNVDCPLDDNHRRGGFASFMHCFFHALFPYTSRTLCVHIFSRTSFHNLSQLSTQTCSPTLPHLFSHLPTNPPSHPLSHPPSHTPSHPPSYPPSHTPSHPPSPFCTHPRVV